MSVDGKPINYDKIEVKCEENYHFNNKMRDVDYNDDESQIGET